jgi:hypothetical protein
MTKGISGRPSDNEEFGGFCSPVSYGDPDMSEAAGEVLRYLGINLAGLGVFSLFDIGYLQPPAS